MQKKERNYIFWIRRSTDLDHILPIIFSLTQGGVNARNIDCQLLSPHFSLKNVYLDKRIAFLSSLNINITESIKYKIYKLIAFLPFSKIKVKTERFFFRLYINSVINNLNKDSINIMDHSASYENIYIAEKLSKKGIINISVPHGVTFFEGHIDPKEWGRLFPSGGNKLSIYDIVVMPNYFSKSLLCNNIPSEKIRVLGSSRFNMKWLSVLENIYSVSPLEDKQKTKVLFFLEKAENYLYGDSRYKFFENLLKLINYLDNNKEIKLIIKAHPAMHPKERNYYTKIKSKIFFDEKKTSFELVRESDLIIGTETSALSDAILMKKNVLIPLFCSPFINKLSRYGIPVVNNLQECIELLDKIINKTFSPNEVKINEFRKEFLMDENEDVLEKYFKFLTNI